ncbi:MAG: hypothetical protein HFJ17_02745 [Clostridia bacterium]|nr:hypothetical protein [Clostridia bacterium]
MLNLFRKETSGVRKDSPEVIAARKYLEKTYPTLLPRDGTLIGNDPFNYIGYSRNGSYIRCRFCEGCDKRIIYIVLCEEERKKIIQLFNEKMKEKVKDYEDEFVYKGSLKGMFVGENVKHCFFSKYHKSLAFMSDEGEIEFQPILEDVDME